MLVLDRYIFNNITLLTYLCDIVHGSVKVLFFFINVFSQYDLCSTNGPTFTLWFTDRCCEYALLCTLYLVQGTSNVSVVWCTLMDIVSLCHVATIHKSLSDQRAQSRENPDHHKAILAILTPILKHWLRHIVMLRLLCAHGYRSIKLIRCLP